MLRVRVAVWPQAAVSLQVPSLVVLQRQALNRCWTSSSNRPKDRQTRRVLALAR